MPPTLPTSKYRTTSLATLTCPPDSFQELWLIDQTTLNGPAPSLHPNYRGFITTTNRSASAPRVGTQHLTVSAAWRSSSYHPQLAGGGIGACLPTFHAAAADQARVASMPDTIWPVGGYPPDSSRDRRDAPVSMSHIY